MRDMRTTLDIDDRALAGARSRARLHATALGQALSELALRGYDAEEAAASDDYDGAFPRLPRVPGHVITDQTVEGALASDP